MDILNAPVGTEFTVTTAARSEPVTVRIEADTYEGMRNHGSRAVSYQGWLDPKARTPGTWGFLSADSSGSLALGRDFYRNVLTIDGVEVGQ